MNRGSKIPSYRSWLSWNPILVLKDSIVEIVCTGELQEALLKAFSSSGLFFLPFRLACFVLEAFIVFSFLFCVGCSFNEFGSSVFRTVIKVNGIQL